MLCTGSLLDAADLHQVADMVADPNTGVHTSQEISIISKKRRSLRKQKTRKKKLSSRRLSVLRKKDSAAVKMRTSISVRQQRSWRTNSMNNCG